jgi:hypothetical protein
VLLRSDEPGRAITCGHVRPYRGAGCPDYADFDHYPGGLLSGQNKLGRSRRNPAVAMGTHTHTHTLRPF